MPDWRSIPKIDAHIHLLPPDVIAANQGYGDRFVDFGSAEDYLALMDQYHIETAFVMPFNDPCMLSMDFQVASVHNNLLEMCRRSGKRLYCFADIDLKDPIEATLAQLERAMENEEFLGVKLHASNAGYPLDGAYYDRVFAWANANDVLLELHSYPREHLPDDVCSPSRIKNVLKKYPQLRLSVAHLGGFQYAELLGLDLYVNLSAILTDLADRYGIEKTNEILRALDVKRLVFATDHPDNRRRKPDEIYEAYFDILDQMDFTPEEAADICKFNALRMCRRKGGAEPRPKDANSSPRKG